MESVHGRPVVAILGETASGKSEIGVHVCEALDGEVISADSMQVYKDLRIGTGVLPEEERRGIPHHLIRFVGLQEPFSVGDYLRRYQDVLAGIRQRGKWPVVVGGTGMYARAVLEGLFEGPAARPEFRRRLLEFEREAGVGTLHRRLSEVDPVSSSRIPPSDARRIVRALEVYEITGLPISSQQDQWRGHLWDAVAFGMRRQRPDCHQRIALRVAQMASSGWIEEAKDLVARGLVEALLAKGPIGYAEIIAHARGEMGLDEAKEIVIMKTRKLAKKQRTWFKAMKAVRWIDVAPGQPSCEVAREVVASLREEGLL